MSLSVIGEFRVELNPISWKTSSCFSIAKGFYFFIDQVSVSQIGTSYSATLEICHNIQY